MKTRIVHKRVIVLLLIFSTSELYPWGFRAHKQITQMAVYTLPEEMVPFYKKHMDEVINGSVQPDIRRYVVKGEAPKHFIDIDYYGDSALINFPRTWTKALDEYDEDTLLEHGILPYAILLTKYNLTQALKEKNGARIIRYAADLSHYVADAHVPLHTTYNYNGQFTGQKGIHALWETRIPGIESEDYSFWVGKASYISNITSVIWDVITTSHALSSKVLSIEKSCSLEFPQDKKYGFEQAGKYEKRVYSQEYALYYSRKMEGMVEDQMSSAVKLIGDLWFTSWVDAGQPLLDNLKIKIERNQPISSKDSIQLIRKRALLHNE